MFIKPAIDQFTKDQLNNLFKLTSRNDSLEITFAFYYDLFIKSIRSISNMMDNNGWPENQQYLMCADIINGNNNTASIISIDLLSYLYDNYENTTFGQFSIESNVNEPFIKYVVLKFTMDINSMHLYTTTEFPSTNNGEVVELGQWKNGLNHQLTITNSTEMQQLVSSVTYRIYTNEQKPFVIRDPNAPKGFKGYSIDLINLIADALKFDYDIYEEDSIGTLANDGEWNGVVKKIMDKEADIGIGAISLMEDRETVIDFTIPFYDLVGLTIMMKSPTISNSLFKFLSVMETNVWLCILLTLTITSFLLWFFNRWNPNHFINYDNYNHNINNNNNNLNFKDYLWFCITSLTPHGTNAGGKTKCKDVLPNHLSGRIIVAIWWLFGFIIISSYTANLGAFLTVSRLDKPIESIDDLANQFKILYAPLNRSIAMQFFQRMSLIEKRFNKMWLQLSLNDSLSAVERAKLAVWEYPISSKYTKMLKFIRMSNPPITLNEAYERVLNSTDTNGYAFIGDGTDINYMVMTECGLQTIGEEFSRKSYAMMVQQGSPLKERIDKILQTLLNKRELEKLKKKWWNDEGYQRKCQKFTKETDGISIENVGGIFIMMFTGIGIACLILIFEYLWFSS